MRELEDRMELNEETGSPPQGRKKREKKKRKKKGRGGGANETRLGERDTGQGKGR